MWYFRKEINYLLGVLSVAQILNNIQFIGPSQWPYFVNLRFCCKLMTFPVGGIQLEKRGVPLRLPTVTEVKESQPSK